MSRKNAAPDEVLSLVKFTQVPPGFARHWRVAGGDARWRDRIGLHVGVLEIRNARAHAIVLDFGAGAIGAFHENDLFPAPELPSTITGYPA